MYTIIIILLPYKQCNLCLKSDSYTNVGVTMQKLSVYMAGIFINYMDCINSNILTTDLI